jgi:hypothetical protein
VADGQADLAPPDVHDGRAAAVVRAFMPMKLRCSKPRTTGCTQSRRSAWLAPDRSAAAGMARRRSQAVGGVTQASTATGLLPVLA